MYTTTEKFMSTLAHWNDNVNRACEWKIKKYSCKKSKTNIKEPFLGDGMDCVYIDGCWNEPCEEGTCVSSSPGEYKCQVHQCAAGYKLTGDGCVDVDECALKGLSVRSSIKMIKQIFKET